MATNNYMPMGRNPRSGGAGQAASYKKGGMTKIAGVMGKGGAKYQDKGAVIDQVKSGISPDIFKATESTTTRRRVPVKGSPNKYFIEQRPTPISADSLAKEQKTERRQLIKELKKGGPVTALDQVQRMHSKKKK